MAIKKKDFDIIVIGTGLSGLSFIESYLEKKQKNKCNFTRFCKKFI